MSGYSQHCLSVGVIYVDQNFKKQPDCESMAGLPMPLICPFPLALGFPCLLDSDQILIICSLGFGGDGRLSAEAIQGI